MREKKRNRKCTAMVLFRRRYAIVSFIYALCCLCTLRLIPLLHHDRASRIKADCPDGRPPQRMQCSGFAASRRTGGRVYAARGSARATKDGGSELASAAG